MNRPLSVAVGPRQAENKMNDRERVYGLLNTASEHFWKLLVAHEKGEITLTPTLLKDVDFFQRLLAAEYKHRDGEYDKEIDRKYGRDEPEFQDLDGLEEGTDRDPDWDT